MPSLKQIEAFYWSSQLGSFVAAAERLNTTQSNISKRIQDLEYTLGVELFDRTRRAIRLTAKGAKLIALSEDLLGMHMRVRQLGASELTFEGPFRFGVTEAVALTWLPRFTRLVQTRFPGLIPISTVDTSVHLNAHLMGRKIDLAIATERNLDPALIRVQLAEAERVWVASPDMIADDRVLDADDLSRLPMLGHGDAAVHHNLVTRYLSENDVRPNIVTSCTSMTVLARMVMDGVGITYLHKDVFADEIRDGRLRVIRTALEIPPVRYVAAYRDDVISPVAELVAEVAREACNFSAIAAVDAG